MPGRLFLIRSLWIGLGLAAALAGCNAQTEPDGLSDEPLLAIAPAGELLPPASPSNAELAARAAPAGETPPAAERRLERGEFFPFTRTITRTLVQALPQGDSTSTFRLEMNLVLTVEETRDDGRARLGVRYERVKYARNFAGDEFAFDSRVPAAALPLDAQPYHGLVGHGFSWWTAPDNHVLELVGFGDFLARSLRGVPPESRGRILSEKTALPADAAIGEFLDPAIGLWREPGGRAPAMPVGESWTAGRHEAFPAPYRCSTRYTLSRCDAQTAEIEILGTISPARDDEAGESAAAVRRGHLFGRCIIDRRTGLPTDAQLEQRLELRVATPGGGEIEQQKTVISTLRAAPLPERERPAPAAVPGPVRAAP